LVLQELRWAIQTYQLTGASSRHGVCSTPDRNNQATVILEWMGWAR